MYFSLGQGKDYLYHGKTRFEGWHTKKELKLSEKQSIAIGPSLRHENIFPEYFLIQIDNFHNQVKKDIDEWIYMLKNDEVKPEFKALYIQEAADKLAFMKMSEQDQRKYERSAISTTEHLMRVRLLQLV